jgi:hypothetical protein
MCVGEDFFIYNMGDSHLCTDSVSETATYPQNV